MKQPVLQVKEVMCQDLIDHSILKAFVFFHKKCKCILVRIFFKNVVIEVKTPLFCPLRDAYRKSWYNGTCLIEFLLFMLYKDGRQQTSFRKKNVVKLENFFVRLGMLTMKVYTMILVLLSDSHI